MVTSKFLAFISGPVAFALILITGPYEGMSPEACAVLAGTVWTAIWWITEVFPLAITALLPIVLFPLTNGLGINEVTAPYGHRLIFLYLGGFIIAIGIQKWNLHRRIALNIVKAIGTNSRYIVLGFMIASAFLSMWISNTATSIMMLPIGVAIILQMGQTLPKKQASNFSKCLMISIAYACSIGGVATIIGTPPNAVLVGVVAEYFNYEIIFSQWMLFAFPLSVMLLLISWVYLTRYAFCFKEINFDNDKSAITEELKKMGKLTVEEKRVLYIFLFTSLAWISRSFLLSPWLPNIDDTIIAIVGAVLLFIVPAKSEGKLMDWESLKALPWNIIILFGGGLAIAKGVQVSGLATWIGHHLSDASTLLPIIMILLIACAIIFLTELTSNLATSSMILPILAALAPNMGIHPFIIMFVAAVGASCAFMLPVATPPNAVVFGSGYITIKDMMKTGFILNIISIILVSIYTYFMVPLIWDYPL